MKIKILKNTGQKFHNGKLREHILPGDVMEVMSDFGQELWSLGFAEILDLRPEQAIPKVPPELKSTKKKK